MENRASTNRPVTVRIVTLPFGSLAEMACTSCDAPLDFYQPDPIRTDRFLATCSQCGDWSVVQNGQDTATAQVVSLEPISTELDQFKIHPQTVDH